MDDLISLILLTLYISPNGALSPGPLTFSTMVIGSVYGWKGGFRVALGHMLVELPYIVMLTLFYSTIYAFLLIFEVKALMTVIVSGFIFYFAYLALRDSLSKNPITSISATKFFKANPFLTGILLTGLNPYFLLWWATVGLPILVKINEIGFHALPVMFLSHIWYDFVWLVLIAYLFRLGINLVNLEIYKIILMMISLAFFVFGINILLKTFVNITLIPF